MPSGNLRVHGGAEGGRRLLTPRGIRPSQGVLKEAIFNMLGTAVLEVSAIDLFAGSGALGIEALSRGAANVTFVERDDVVAGVLKRNLQALGYLDRTRVARAEATRWLEAQQQGLAEAGLVLLDPPYNDPVLERALVLLDRLCAPGTLVVAEHAPRQALAVLSRLEEVRSRRYGDSAVAVLRAR